MSNSILTLSHHDIRDQDEKLPQKRTLYLQIILEYLRTQLKIAYQKLRQYRH